MNCKFVKGKQHRLSAHWVTTPRTGRTRRGSSTDVELQHWSANTKRNRDTSNVRPVALDQRRWQGCAA
jgi:hypothetical protein